MSRRYQLRSFSRSGTRIRGHLTNLDWKSRAQTDAVLHAGFDIEASDVPSLESATNARDVAVALISFLKGQQALLPDAITDFAAGEGQSPVAVFLRALPALPDFS